ncbi:MAG: sodium:solute symporter [Clostridiales bacterium]|jgi:SSS family transporter|nr:sodium:solute symporter [Clostridiales bacterium]
MFFNVITLLLYMLAIVAISVYSRNRGRTTQDFVLANRGMGAWMSAFAYGTTYFSAVIFVGYAGKFGWSYGLGAVWIGIGNAVIGSLIAWMLLARRTRELTNRLQVTTMSGFFEKRYLDGRLKLASAIIIFIFLLPYSASVYQGLAHAFEMVFGINFIWCVAIMAALTALYVFFGGYLGTALSNFMQGIIMLIGVAAVTGIFVAQPQVGFDGLLELSRDGLGLFPQSTGGGLIDNNIFNLIIVVMLTSFGVWALPQVIHKYYAVKDSVAIKRATVISTLFALVTGGGAYFIGGLGKLFLSELPAGGYDVVMPTLLERYIPAGLLGLIVVMLLSASMSTLSALAISGSSSLAIDIYKGYINRDAQDNKVNLVMKVLCVVYILISALLAIAKIDAIVTLMSLSWGTLSGCFIGPYVLGLYSKRVTSAAAMASMIGGVAFTVAMVAILGSIYPNGDFTGIMAVIKGGIARAPLIGVLTMAFSMIITPVVSAFTKKPDGKKVEEMFEGIN